jgi:hypothetical protein
MRAFANHSQALIHLASFNLARKIHTIWEVNAEKHLPSDYQMHEVIAPRNISDQPLTRYKHDIRIGAISRRIPKRNTPKITFLPPFEKLILNLFISIFILN